MSHRRPTAALLASTILLGGCAGAPAATAPTSAPAATASTTPTPTVPASVQCLETGTWVVDNTREAELFAEGLRGAATDVTATRTGEAAWVFTGGVLTRTFTAWQLSFSAALNVNGVSRVVETSTLNGSTTAGYEVTASDVVTQPADVAALTVDVVATKDGAPVTFEDPGSSAREGQEQAQAWGFTCEADTLLLAARAEDGTLAETFGTILLHRR